jgi:hypothetical protein
MRLHSILFWGGWIFFVAYGLNSQRLSDLGWWEEGVGLLVGPALMIAGLIIRQVLNARSNVKPKDPQHFHL